MKIRCLLIDDEPPALKILARYINDIAALEIVGQCNNALEAIEVLRQKKVDVIFLDIKMPRIIGTEFFRNLAHPPKVIFVTAYREYAVDGFELDAVDYLVKPVSFERFLKAVTKLTRILGSAMTTTSIEPAPPAEAFVYVRMDKGMNKIVINEIKYIESCKDFVTIFLNDGKKLLVKQSITSMENLLSEHKFLRVHRSYIISLDKVSGYSGLSIMLKDSEIPIGRLYKQAVMGRLNEY
ncbi:MAG TPA: LytTR family DNA-binding domain-containing protein [Chryseolinea sp.]|nr:LytTR family DNA-binding domain-containing protein [Chryseolinea sp.]